MNCSVKMQIGEEVFDTPKSLDTPETQPVWEQGYIIEVPQCLKTSIFEVYD